MQAKGRNSWAEINTSDVLQVLWTLSWVGALLTVPSVLLQRAGRPIAAVSWILALFALPALALAAWWLSVGFTCAARPQATGQLPDNGEIVVRNPA